jgi:hypothetical protein
MPHKTSRGLPGRLSYLPIARRRRTKAPGKALMARQDRPESHRLLGENRRCSLEQFPYALWFKVENDVVVVGCLHAKRDPKLANDFAAWTAVAPMPTKKGFQCL